MAIRLVSTGALINNSLIKEDPTVIDDFLEAGDSPAEWGDPGDEPPDSDFSDATQYVRNRSPIVATNTDGTAPGADYNDTILYAGSGALGRFDVSIMGSGGLGFIASLASWADNEIPRWEGASTGPIIIQGSSIFIDDSQNITGINDITLLGLLIAGSIGVGTTSPESLVDIRGPAGTGAATAGVLTLSTAELTMVDGDYLGKLDFNSSVPGDATTSYATGSVTAGANLTDFTLLIDLSDMPASWWALVDTSDGTKGRVFKEDGTELASDWRPFDNGANTGWIRVKWSETLSGSAANTIRVYVPLASRSSYAASHTYGSGNARDPDWKLHLGLDEAVNNDVDGYVDRTQYGNHGTGNSMALPAVDGKVGPAQKFDGIADFIDTDDSASQDFPSGFTLSVWAKPVNTDADARVIYRYDAGSQDGYYLGQGLTGSGTWEFVVFVGGSVGGIGSNDPPTGNMQHICGVRTNDGTLLLYIDAVLQTDTGSMAGAIDSNDGVSIAADRDGIWNFEGLIDDVHIHSAPWSADEVNEEYSQTNDNTEYWRTWSWVPAPPTRVVTASIHAEADDTFAQTVTKTDLVFALGTTTSAVEKMRLTSAGALILVGTITAGSSSTLLTTAVGLLRHQSIDPSIAGTGLGVATGVLSVNNAAALVTLSDNSIADALHRHSELVASDGSPDPALSIDATGNITTVASLRVDGGNIGITSAPTLLGLASNLLTIRGDLAIDSSGGLSDIKLESIEVLRAAAGSVIMGAVSTADTTVTIRASAGDAIGIDVSKNVDIKEDLQVDGNLTVDGFLTVRSDLDGTTILGRAKIGTVLTDMASFGHFDFFSPSNVALRQTITGSTLIGAPTGQTIALLVNDSAMLSVASGVITISGDLIIGGDTYWEGAGTGLPYSDMYVNDNAATTSVSSAGFTQVTIFNTNGHSNLATPDHTNDHITIVKAGVYMVDCCITVANNAGSGHKIEVIIAKNNGSVIFANCRRHRTLASGTDVGALPICGHIDVNENDTIEVWAKSDSGAAKNVTFEDINLNLTMVGGT